VEGEEEVRGWGNGLRDEGRRAFHTVEEHTNVHRTRESGGRK
jgi:hypothetical protein